MPAHHPFALSLVVILLSASAAAQEAPRTSRVLQGVALLPVPSTVVLNEGGLVVDEGFTVGLEGACDPMVRRAVVRFLGRLQARTGLPLRPDPLPSGKGTLQLQCRPAAARSAGTGGDATRWGGDERYTLDVAPQGARLDAPAAIGMLRGLATMQQLVRPGPDGIRAPAVHLEDAPRFGWRGLMLDVARHFAPADAVLRTLDAMESVKLNVLHLHLSDNEGFRVESRRYPRLTAYPSSGGQFYTQAEVRAIVAAARDRGIRVVPEFEMPGHVQSILVAYPELGSATKPMVRGRGPETMLAALDPSRESTYRFLAALLGEMAALFPDPAMHVAGDEVAGQQWAANPGIAGFMRRRGLETPHKVQAYFTRRVAAIVSSLGKTPIVWDEALNAELPKGVIVQAWRSSKMVQRAAAAGHTTIVSAGYYLDHVLPASRHYDVDPLDTRAVGLPEGMLASLKGTPLEPYVGEAMVAADAPLLTDPERALVAGGEAAVWTELVPDGHHEMYAWPRAAAVAERLWSPAGVRDRADLTRRLELVSADLELQGLQHRFASVRALRRLAAGGDFAPLAVLAEAVEPLKNLARLMPLMQGAMAGVRSPVYFPPMNRFADAVPPESPAAREFNEAAARAAGTDRDATVRRLLRTRLNAWRDNHPGFARVAEGSSLLGEVVPVSDEVRRLAEAGLEALDALDAGFPLASERSQALRALLAPHLAAEAATANLISALMARHPSHGLSIAIVPGVSALVDAASPRS